MGAIARQGPHHVAQKSSSTGLSDFKTSWSKFASVTSTIPLPAIFVSPRCNVALSADAPVFWKQRVSLPGPDDSYEFEQMLPKLGPNCYRTTGLMRGPRRRSQEPECAVAD